MKIRVGHSTKSDFKTDLYEPLRSLQLPPGVVLSLPHECSSEGDCTREYFASGCDLFLAEVSHQSTGLGMELAFAFASRVPIVCIHREDAQPSSSIRRVTNVFYVYRDQTDIRTIVERLITAYTRTPDACVY